MPVRLTTTFGLGLALCCLIAGCGSGGPEMARVSGKVTYKGAPVTKGLITYVSTTPGGRNATGQIQSDGTFKLQTENPADGAILGDYDVTISARDEPILDYKPATPPTPKFLVPEKYEKPGTSGLKKKVERGANTHNFELND